MSNVKASLHAISHVDHEQHESWTDVHQYDNDSVLRIDFPPRTDRDYRESYSRMVAASEEFLRKTAARFPGLSDRIVDDLRAACQTLTDAPSQVAEAVRPETGVLPAAERSHVNMHAVCPRCVGNHNKAQCRSPCIICLHTDGHAHDCPIQTKREIKTAVSESIIDKMLGDNREDLSQAAEELAETSKTVALLMEQEATRRTITTNDDRQIPFVLTPSGILQAAIIYDLESENIGANLHIFNSEYPSDVQRFSEYYQGDSSLLRVAPAATDQPVPSTSTSTPVMFQREEYEGYKTVLDQLGWKMVLDDAPTMQECLCCVFVQASHCQC